MPEPTDVDVSEPVEGEVHITADHEKGEWIILDGMTTLDAERYR